MKKQLQELIRESIKDILLRKKRITERLSEHDYERKLEYYCDNPELFEKAREEFMKYAEIPSDSWVRELGYNPNNFYPGWTHEDFARLISDFDRNKTK